MIQRTALPFRLWRLFALRRDQATPDVIDANIRAGVKIGGTNLWILMFAIMIASVGLNVNSTATIIGAMLISPLMGPIISAGYGAGINDFALIRQALRSLAIFATISLLTSTLYFLVTPLHDAQSELLARTSPNLWDVLIAFFGGAAGMIGLSRKEKTTVIAGVGIATALMPPLCTVGFGIATGQPAFIVGAFYLFAINGVFIALATLVVTRILRLPQHHFPDETARKRGRMIIATVVAVTLLPSVYLAMRLVQDQVFSTRANRFIDTIATSEKSLIVANREVDAEKRRINLWLVGGDPDLEVQKKLEARLPEFKIADAQLDLHLANAGERLDAVRLRQQQFADMHRSAAQQLEEHQARLRLLEEKARVVPASNLDLDVARLADEIRAQEPSVKKVTITREVGAGGTAAGVKEHLVVLLEVSKALPPGDRKRLERWLTVRLPSYAVSLMLNRG